MARGCDYLAMRVFGLDNGDAIRLGVNKNPRRKRRGIKLNLFAD